MKQSVATTYLPVPERRTVIAPPLLRRPPAPSLFRQTGRQLLWQLASTRIAWLVLLIILLLCAVGLAAVNACGTSLLRLQELHLLIGLAVLLAALVPAYHRLGRYAYAFYMGSVLLLLAVRFGPSVQGSHRWFLLPAGMSFQPSELAKIGFVMAVARYLANQRSCRTLHTLLVPFLLLLAPLGLIVLEPDLGTSLLFVPVCYAMLIAAGARLRHLLVVLLIAAAAAPACYPLLHPYQQQRLRAMLVFGQPNSQQLHGDLYQRWQSEVAEGSGGLRGQGLRGAWQIHHGLLPEAASDFVFAVLANQWGFFGSLAVLLLYGVFFAAGLEIAGDCSDPFGRLLVVGLSSFLILQAVINIGMTTGLLPVVGITLPFMSYGGSAVVTDLLMAGLILNVATHRRRAIFETRWGSSRGAGAPVPAAWRRGR